VDDAVDDSSGGGAEPWRVREAGSVALPAPAVAFEGVTPGGAAPEGARRSGALDGGVIGGTSRAGGAVNGRGDAGGAASPAGSASVGTTAIRGATRPPSGVAGVAAASACSTPAAGARVGVPRAPARLGVAAAGMEGTGVTGEPLPAGRCCEGFANHRPMASNDAPATAPPVAMAARRHAACPRAGSVATLSLSIRQTAAAVASPPVPGRIRRSS
jgi:hypothetical protein